MADINILKKDTLSNNMYLLQNITFEKQGLNGKPHEQKNEVYFRPDGVTILLVDEEHESFLLVKQFRLPAFLNGSKDGYLLETCAGLIDEGETPEQAAVREVREETGYTIESVDKVGGIYSSAGGITEFVHLFVAHFNTAAEHGEGGGKAGEGEDIELVHLNFTEARQKLNDAAINDAKTLMLLQHYFMHAK